MKIYSTFKINAVALLITIFIYAFFTLYLPKLVQTAHDYVYYKIQPQLEQEYE